MGCKYVADFETTTIQNDCRVWAYAVTEVADLDEHKEVLIGTTIKGFMNWCSLQTDNPTIYFHNLKFDSQFIIYYLLKNGFEHFESEKKIKRKGFTTLISDQGMYYSISVVFSKSGKHTQKVTFLDSLKLIPLSVDAIAKSFKLPISKLKIDYTAHDKLAEGTPLTETEENYIKHDVKIIAHAVNFFHSNGLDKMTIGSCALNDYKKVLGKTRFNRFFPPSTEYHDDLKQSYKGGFTFLNSDYKEKEVGEGVTLDVNSLYPSVMYHDALPYGTPIFFEGKYQKDDLYPLYVQMFTCQFDIKPGKLPTIQARGIPTPIQKGVDKKGKPVFYKMNEYLLGSHNQEVTLCLTSVDMELFFEHYKPENVIYINGWKFKETKGLFKDYIDKWSKIKIESKKEGNHGMYLISKLFLNSLYGKFGTNTKVKEKIPYLNYDDDTVHYRDTDEKEKEGIYIAIASFITSYARRKVISSAQTVEDNYRAGKSKIRFIYCDTDSLHLDSPGYKLPEYLNIDSTLLGWWDYEAKFKRGKFLRSKCYMELLVIDEVEYSKGKEGDTPFLYSKDENEYYKLKITVAGMPMNCQEQVTFDNFEIGAVYKGKRAPKVVSGGVVLKEVDFTINR